MPPQKHDERTPSDAESRRVLNTPENAGKAIAAARANISHLVGGRAWRHRTPHGANEVKGALTLDNAPVVVLHFSPEDGSVLPKGLHGLTEGRADIIELVETRLKDAAQQLTVLDGAEFREPESCWAVPIAHQGRIVAHVKISSDGTRILPDKKAAEELGEVK
jgi:hypothetical protein